MALPKFFKTRKAKILLGLLIFIIALRIALPYIVLHLANKNLASMNGYYGHIQDVDIALYRGAYTLDSFYLNKVAKASGDQSEFISARQIDLSVEWKALLKGKVVGELVFDRPVLRFIENKVELKEVSKDTANFRELLEDFMPISINRVEFLDGKLQYADLGAKPKVDVGITELYLLALNLKNAYKSDEVLPASIEADGKLYGGGLKLSMKLNPLADDPTFDLNGKVENTDLTQLNDMFQAYAGFDVSKGRFNMYAEAATKDRKFAGYVKPLIEDLDVVEWQGQDKKDGFFQKVWESIVGGAGELLENQKTDQVATRVNFSGNLDDPTVNVFQVIVLVLQNAFISALKPSIENKISLAKVGEESGKKQGFFKELFNGNQDDKGDEKKGDKKKERREKKKARKKED